VIERGPGVQGEAHYHPGGHEWFHVASGALLFTNGDQQPKLLTAGQGDYIPPGVVHHGRNPSPSEPVKLVLFYLGSSGSRVGGLTGATARKGPWIAAF
jgi:quercetin dioxygenase-like cupin family protein